jgi:ABC-type nitrate/sulfonate/bicarbonate transport system substrate-binding protein
MVRGFVRAFTKSMRYCQENVDGTLKTLLKYSKEWGVDSLDIAKAAYEEVAPFWRLEPDPAVLDRAMQKFAEQQGLPAAPVGDFLDLRFLEEALQQAP